MKEKCTRCDASGLIRGSQNPDVIGVATCYECGGTGKAPALLRIKRGKVVLAPKPDMWHDATKVNPEFAARDDTPCTIGGQPVAPLLTSKTLVVALDGGGIRTDQFNKLDKPNSPGFWFKYGPRVTHWMEVTPPTTPPQARPE